MLIQFVKLEFVYRLIRFALHACLPQSLPIIAGTELVCCESETDLRDMVWSSGLAWEKRASCKVICSFANSFGFTELGERTESCLTVIFIGCRRTC